MDALKFVISTAWQRAGILGRVIAGIFSIGPAVLAASSGYLGAQIIMPWWGWAAFSIIIVVLFLFYFIAKKARELEYSIKPKIKIIYENNDCFYLHDDHNDYHYYYFLIQNVGSSPINECTAKIEKILFKNDNPISESFPLRVFHTGKEKFKLLPGESTKISLFAYLPNLFSEYNKKIMLGFWNGLYSDSIRAVNCSLIVKVYSESANPKEEIFDINVDEVNGIPKVIMQ
jgi:MFS family permease